MNLNEEIISSIIISYSSISSSVVFNEIFMYILLVGVKISQKVWVIFVPPFVGLLSS